MVGGGMAGLLGLTQTDAKKKGKGKGKGKKKDKKRTSAQAEPCWRAGACIPRKGANISQCNLEGYAPSTTLNCTGCNISRANLRGADLRGANLTRANLSGSCLTNADLTGAIIANTTNLYNAIFCNTTMPDGSINNSSCGSVTACCPGPCLPDCAEKACGADDGCGGICQTESCTNGQICCNGTCCDGCCRADASCGACLVFLSSFTTRNGNLGGLEGADAICQGLAQNATPRLPGTYKAWLSIDNTPNQSPASGRFRRSSKPYQLVTGAQIAANWSDLTDGGLAASIDRTESGETFGARASVWTNTRPDGTAGSQDGGMGSCQGWRSAVSTEHAGVGDSDAPPGLGRWTLSSNGFCDLTPTPDASDRRLYCFQQQ